MPKNLTFYVTAIVNVKKYAITFFPVKSCAFFALISFFYLKLIDFHNNFF